MIKRRILIFLFSCVMLSSLLCADWQEIVKRHLGDFMVFDKLSAELAGRFEAVPAAEKGAAALILAYSFQQMQAERAVVPALGDVYSKSAGAESKQVSYWLERFFEEFAAQDRDLGFLLPDRQAVRDDILKFKAACEREFPLLGIEAQVQDLGVFFKLTLHIESSAACGYEIFGPGSALLLSGVLEKGINKRIVQVGKRSGKEQEDFIKLVVYNRYINEEKFIFEYPGAAVEATVPAAPQPRSQKKNIKKNAKSNESKAYKPKTRFGLLLSAFPRFRYYVYRQGLREKVETAGTHFSESEFFFSMLLKKSYEIGLFYRRFRAEDVSIAGGLWSTKKSYAGISLGKVFTLSGPGRRFLVDISGGPYAAGIFDRDYVFVSGQRDDRVAGGGSDLSYGVYMMVRLRLAFLRKTRRPEFPVIALGFRYYYPFNDFEYSAEPGAVYRLHRQSFFIGFYFR